MPVIYFSFIFFLSYKPHQAHIYLYSLYFTMVYVYDHEMEGHIFSVSSFMKDHLIPRYFTISLHTDVWAPSIKHPVDVSYLYVLQFQYIWFLLK